MSKYVGLLIGLGFALFYVFKLLRNLKPSPPGVLRTGVSRWSYPVVAILLLVGPILLFFAVDRLHSEIYRELNWIPANAFVTELVPSGWRKGRTVYRARFHFQTSKETGSVDHEVVDLNETMRPPAVATAIRVLYDPTDPDRAVIDDVPTRWIVGLGLLIASALCLGFAGGAMRQILKLQALSDLRTPSSRSGNGTGKLLKVKRNFFLSLKHNPSYRLIVEYQDLSGRKHVAHSEPIWGEHPETWSRAELDVPLTLDRTKPHRAWVRVQDYYKACQNL